MVFTSGSLNFRRSPRDLPGMTALVEACSHTLEHIDITLRSCCKSTPFSFPSGTNPRNNPTFELDDPSPGFPNLSRATKLQGASIRLLEYRHFPLVAALKSITSEQRDFRTVSIYILFDQFPLLSVVLSTSDKLLERDTMNSGWTSTTFSPNFTSRTRFMRGSWYGMKRYARRALESCCRRPQREGVLYLWTIPACINISRCS